MRTYIHTWYFAHRCYLRETLKACSYIHTHIHTYIHTYLHTYIHTWYFAHRCYLRGTLKARSSGGTCVSCKRGASLTRSVCFSCVFCSSVCASAIYTYIYIYICVCVCVCYIYSPVKGISQNAMNNYVHARRGDVPTMHFDSQNVYIQWRDVCFVL